MGSTPPVPARLLALLVLMEAPAEAPQLRMIVLMATTALATANFLAPKARGWNL
jgi:hypothetical protein